MAIALDQETTGGTPVLKRRDIGQRFRGAVIKFENRDLLKDDKPVLKDNGKPKQELVVHLLAIKSTMPAGIGGEEAPPEEGDIVRVILRGGGYGQWIDALKTLPRVVHVGDILDMDTTHAVRFMSSGDFRELGQFTTSEEIAAYKQGDEWMNRKETLGYRGSLSIRIPTDEEGDIVTKAEAAYHRLNKETIALAPQGSGPFDNPASEEEPW